MLDLLALIRQPGVAFPALLLYQETVADVLHTLADARASGLGPLLTDGRAVADEEALAAYRQAIVELQQELDKAKRDNDSETASQLLREKQALEDEILAVDGKFAKSARRRTAEEERARKAIQTRVSAAFGRLDSDFPPLADHLRASIQLGLLCSYNGSEQWTVATD
jgi:hypothetical protein